MKKILFLSLIFLSTLSNAQLGYRYSVVPGGTNKYATTYKEIKSISYAASIAVTPFSEQTTYRIGQLTGALTMTSILTKTYTGDKMTVIFNADGTARTVTFSTGFSASGTLVVAASTYATVEFTFNGSAWQETSRRSAGAITAASITEQTSGSGITFSKQTFQLRTATTYTATGSITVTAAELAGGLLVAATSTTTTTFTLPTAAQIVTQTGATAGTTFEFVVVNNGASNGTVTVAVGSGIVASDFPGTNTLTRTGSATVGAAVFRLTFLTTSAAVLTRIG